jgi:hypothetical protein
MSLEATYRGRRAVYVNDYVIDGGWVGAILDYGDGLTFGVLFGDPSLTIDPDDSEWEAAEPLLDPLPGPFITQPDGTTAIVHMEGERKNAQ